MKTMIHPQNGLVHAVVCSSTYNGMIANGHQPMGEASMPRRVRKESREGGRCDLGVCDVQVLCKQVCTCRLLAGLAASDAGTVVIRFERHVKVRLFRVQVLQCSRLVCRYVFLSQWMSDWMQPVVGGLKRRPGGAQQIRPEGTDELRMIILWWTVLLCSTIVEVFAAFNCSLYRADPTGLRLHFTCKGRGSGRHLILY